MTGHNTERSKKKNIKIKSIVLNGKEVDYEFERKSVKNVNLRIRRDGSIYVSANRWVSEKAIEDFIIEKSDFVLRALERCRKRAEDAKLQEMQGAEEVHSPADSDMNQRLWDPARARAVIIPIVREVYPMFEKHGVPFPEIKFRKMTRTWGVCRLTAKTITFNTKLASVPYKAAVYVVIHEFTHFLEPNHSKRFYEKLVTFMPDWKEARNLLKDY